MDRSASSIRGASAFGRTGSALGASVGWAASLTDGQRVSAKRLINAASRVGGAAGVPIPVSLYRVLYGGGLGAVASGPSSSAAASSVLTVPVTLDALLERLCEHFERIGDRLEVTPGLPARSTTPAGGAGSAATGGGGGGAGAGGGGGVVVGGALTAESRNLSSKLSLSSLARSTSKAKFVNVASSASLEPHKDLTALVHRQEEEEHQLGTFNPSFTLSIPNRSVLNLVPSHTSVPRQDSVPYVNSYVPGAGGGGEAGAPTDAGGWPAASNGGWGAPPDVPPPETVDGQWPGADLSARGNKSLIEFVGDTLYRKGPPRERWRLGRKLGEGGNSRVYEAVHAVDGTQAAVKIIDKNLLAAGQAEKRLWFEVYAFKLLRYSGGHPNIVELLEVGEDDESVYLCMELLVGGELFSRITDQGQYTEKHAAALVEAMLGALSICHRLNITHRDVKPENWVFTDAGPQAVVKLIDFGICFYSEDPNALCRSIIGTPLYVAPEVLLRQPYGPEADMWSLVRGAGGRRGATVVACGGARAGSGVVGVEGATGADRGALGAGDANLWFVFCGTFRPYCDLLVPVWLSANPRVLPHHLSRPSCRLLCPLCVVLHHRASLCTSCSLGGRPLTTLTRSSSSRRSSTTRWSLLAATGCSSLRRAKTLSPASSTRTPPSGCRRPRRSATSGSATTAMRRRPTCFTWRRSTSAGTTR